MASYPNQQQPIVYPTTPNMYASQSTQQPAHPVVLPPLTNPPPNYSKRASAGLGITQMLLGILFVVFMIVEIAICADNKYQYCTLFVFSGYGLWCGIIVS